MTSEWRTSYCRHCRFSEALVQDTQQVGLWCTVRKCKAQLPCPAFEREPGTEGDDE